MCVFTKVAYPDRAHIIPHSINKSQTHATKAYDALYGLLIFYKPTLWDNVKGLLFEEDTDGQYALGCSDKAFNIISMNPHVHRCFDRAAFSLKPITPPREQRFDPGTKNIEPVCVEWQFLPKQLADAFGTEGQGLHHLHTKPARDRPLPRCEPNLNSEGFAKFLTDHLKAPLGDATRLGDGLPCAYTESGRRIESGMRFYIPAFKDDADKTRWLLELSGLARRISSISGAAEALDDLGDDPPHKWARAYKIASQQARERNRQLLDEVHARGLEEEIAKERMAGDLGEDSDTETASHATTPESDEVNIPRPITPAADTQRNQPRGDSLGQGN